MKVKGVIFDMDGTVTKPDIIDFELIRRTLEVPEGASTFEYIDSLPEKERKDKFKRLAKIEFESSVKAAFNDGFLMIYWTLKQNQIPIALLTRNTRSSTNIVLNKLGICFDIVITREDAPMKPSPIPIQIIAQRWNISTSNLLVVGDYDHDLVAGKSAGALTVFLTNNGYRKTQKPYDISVDSLKDIIPLIFAR